MSGPIRVPPPLPPPPDPDPFPSNVLTVRLESAPKSGLYALLSPDIDPVARAICEKLGIDWKALVTAEELP